MTVPGNLSSPLLATAADAAAAAVATKSLRFNDDDQASLSRTPSSAGNRKTFTYSCWFKRANITRGYLFSVWNSDTDSEVFAVNFSSSHTLNIDLISKTLRITDQVFRDPSAWYHLVLAVDTTQSTASDRLKLYINGSQVTSFSTNVNFSQNDDTGVNGTFAHQIGRYFRNSSTQHPFDGYMADIYLIDGSQLDPTSFGAYDSNGVWQAAAYSGTYGTNGFHLAFGDSSSSAALGTDSSGNSNTFTVNNISGDAVGLSTANQGFGVVTYTGNGGSQSITGVGFQPDFVWIKNRETFTDQVHALFDVVRGKQMLGSHSSNSEADWHGTNSLPFRGYVDSFDSDGFSLAANSASNKADYVNFNNTDYVAWCWKAGGTASSNTDGTITSSVSANTTYGFSVVGYTGNNTSGATVGHGLSSTPKWIIVKSRDQSGQFWHVYHASLDADEYAYLNNSNAVTSGNDFMNGTRPTSSVFSLGNGNGCNKSGDDVIAYCWAEVSGFSKISSYNGSGGAATKVVTGFRPRYIIARPINDSNGNRWHIVDTERGVGGSAERLFAEDGSVHTARQEVLIENDGFIVTNTTTDSGSLNRNTEYIYAAFASKPTGEDIDSLFDVPTNGTQSDTGAGGEVSGNYCTINPLSIPSQSVTVSNGNLDHTGAGTNVARVGTIAIPSSGKWYWEITCKSGGSGAWLLGINGDTMSQALRLLYVSDARKYTDAGGGFSSYGASFTAGDVIGVAVDMDADTLTFYKNGSTQGTAFTSISSGYTNIFPYFQTEQSGRGLTVNFGQRAWAYSAPSNHKALCTTNLPTPTIADGSEYFAAKLYTGNGSTNTITGLEFSPDWTWIKKRNSSSSHSLHDTVRGATKRIRTESTDAETTESTALTAFTSDGFTLGSGGTANGNNDTFVSWNWDAGSSTASNTNGSITSNVRANQTAGFSIVSWTSSSSVSTVGHGLSAAPYFIITKNRSVSNAWWCYHFSLGNTKAIRLDANDAQSTMSSTWNNTSPTSSVFTVGGEFGNGNSMIAYCFAPVAGYSAFGTYEGNNNADGPFLHTNFRPAFFLVKNADASQPWNIYDSSRDTFNVVTKGLQPNKNIAEYSSTDRCDFLSNGIKIKSSGGTVPNLSGNTYIYAAFSENAFSLNGGLAR